MTKWLNDYNRCLSFPDFGWQFFILFLRWLTTFLLVKLTVYWYRWQPSWFGWHFTEKVYNLYPLQWFAKRLEAQSLQRVSRRKKWKFLKKNCPNIRNPHFWCCIFALHLRCNALRAAAQHNSNSVLRSPCSAIASHFEVTPLRPAKRLISGKRVLFFGKSKIEAQSNDTAKGHGGEDAKLRDNSCN